MKRLLTIAFALLAFACSKDDIQLHDTHIRLIAGQTQQLRYSGSGKWSSQEPLIATVENGLVEALRVGTTHIQFGNSKCTVEVYPKYTYYIEPFLDWGANYSTYETLMIDSGCTEISHNATVALWLHEDTNTMYSCLLSDGKIKSTLIMTSLIMAEYCVNYLLERYVALGAVSGYGVLLSIDGKSGITITTQSDYGVDYGLWVMCVPNDTRADSEDIIEQYKALLNDLTTNNLY